LGKGKDRETEMFHFNNTVTCQDYALLLVNEWMSGWSIGRKTMTGENYSRELPVPMPLCVPQIPSGLA